MNTRRTFLKILSALGVGAILPSVAESATDPNSTFRLKPEAKPEWLGYSLLRIEDVKIGDTKLAHGVYAATRLIIPKKLSFDPLKTLQQRAGERVLAINGLELELPNRALDSTARHTVCGMLLGTIQDGQFAGMDLYYIAGGGAVTYRTF